MILEKINHGAILVHLTPDDCATLALACAHSSQELVGADEAGELALISAFGAAFEAMAKAGRLQNDMPLCDKTE